MIYIRTTIKKIEPFYRPVESLDDPGHSLKSVYERIDQELLRTAISHSSTGVNNNERLEFLGNSVLNLCLVNLLYKKYPYDEGRLSKICNFIRSDVSLNDIGREYGMDGFIETGKSIHDYEVTDAMVSGAVEAIIGAFFISQGYIESEKMVEEFVLTEARLNEALNGNDIITKVQEFLNAKGLKAENEVYDMMEDGRMCFYHVIVVGEQTFMGSGRSKREARAAASNDFLVHFKE
jgi:ribonuclease-3